MRNTGLEEAQAGIKTAGRNINNLRYADDFTTSTIGLPGGTSGTELPCQCMGLKRPGLDPWVRKISWRRKWQPTPVFLPGKCKDRGAWQATVHRVARVGLNLVTKPTYLLMTVNSKQPQTEHFPATGLIWGHVGKTSISALLTMPKPLTVWITINWKILKEMGIPDHLTCLLRNLYARQEATVRMDMEQWIGSKLGKEYIKAVYCQPAYLTYMHSTSCKMPSWIKNKLESRLLGKYQ